MYANSSRNESGSDSTRVAILRGVVFVTPAAEGVTSFTGDEGCGTMLLRGSTKLPSCVVKIINQKMAIALAVDWFIALILRDD